MFAINPCNHILIVKHLDCLGFWPTLLFFDFFLAPWLLGFWLLRLTLWFFGFWLTPLLSGPRSQSSLCAHLVIVVNALVLDSNCLIAFEC